MAETETAGEALVAQGNTIVRLENTVQMQVAIQHPRKEDMILAAALKELDLYPSMAEEALYMKPVGTNPDTKKMTYAEGLSIRTAESLANRWTNSSFGCEIVGEDEDTVQLAGVFLDYENNTRHVVVGRVAKSYRARTGQIVKRDPDKLELAVKAEQSKVLREVILRSLPAGLKKEYENKVRKLLKGGKVENRKQAVVQRFSDLNISLETLEIHRGKKMAEWGHEDIVALLGIANAIRDGELTREAAFSNGSEKTKSKASTVQAAEEKGKKEKGLPSWCCGIPEECDAHAFEGDKRICYNDINKPVPCERALKG